MNRSVKIQPVDPNKPNPEIIRKAAMIIKRGGIIVFPTRCLYGLGVDALNKTALNLLFRIKKRSQNNPILIIVKDRTTVLKFIKSPRPYAVELMDRFWPGRLTFVFNAKNCLPARLTGGTAKIGIRLPGHPVAKALSKSVCVPITGTSANIAGQPGCSDIAKLDPQILKSASLILDAGPLKGGMGSTVVDVTGSSPRIIRIGDISAEEISECFTTRTHSGVYQTAE